MPQEERSTGRVACVLTVRSGRVRSIGRGSSVSGGVSEAI
jgi:hypothetical protein